MSSSPWSHHTRNANVSDDIDFEIKGQELQFLEIELDPGESAVAEAGAVRKTNNVLHEIKAI